MQERRVRWISVAAPWSAFAILLAVQTQLSMITHGHSLVRMIAYQLAVWLPWMLITPLLFELARREPMFPFRPRAFAVHAGAALAISVAHIALWITLTIFIKPYDAMTETRFAPYWPSSAYGRVPFELAVYAIVVAAGHAFAQHARASHLERSLGDARLHVLELQLQPHFLFNTLNAVSSLVRAKRGEDAVAVVAGLSDLLRYSLDHTGGQRVPLQKEVAMLERYLEIQRVRFPDRLEIVIDVSDDARRGAIPMLLLQPLAENAVTHGIARSAAPGRIEVKASRNGATLDIEIFNTGALGDAPRGIGLQNTEQRLRGLYGDAYRFELANDRGGVVAKISIPWSEAGL